MNKNNLFTGAIACAVVALLIYMSFHVNTASAATAVAVLKTSGMTCGSCSEKITGALKTVKGVSHTEVDLGNGYVIVGFDTTTTSPDRLAETVSKVGYGSTVNTVLSPEQYRKMTGKDLGQTAQAGGGCCGSGGCGGKMSAPQKP